MKNLILIFFLLILPFSFLPNFTLAQSLILSNEEKSTLLKLGITEDQISKADPEFLKKRLQEEVSKKIDPKVNELKNELNNVKQDSQADLKKLAGGYLMSSISLFAATLIAPQVYSFCSTRPSALIYSGTALLYILSEIANIKVLKASQLAEFDMVSELKIDDTKTLQENINNLKNKVDAQTGYLKAYKKTLDDALKAIKTKAKNAKIASIGFLAASVAALTEILPGSCVVDNKLSPSHNVVSIPFISALHATEKGIIDPSLKNNKVADFYGDIDKLGIVGAGATLLVVYISGFQTTFLKSIITDNVSRSITFGVQSALAFAAGAMFDQAADSFIDKMAKVDKILDQIQADVKLGLDLLGPSDADAEKLQDLATTLGVSSSKPITKMNINEAVQFIKKIKESKNINLNNLDLQFLNKYQEKLKEKINPAAKKTSFIFSILFPEANAATITQTEDKCLRKNLCLPLSLPKFPQSHLSGLNKYLAFLENYSHGLVENNPKKMEENFQKLSQNKNRIETFRNNLFKKMTNQNYRDIENKKIKEQQQLFNQYFQKLSSLEKAQLLQSFDPNIKKPLPVALSIDDKKVLKDIINRLDKISAAKKIGPNIQSSKASTIHEREGKVEEEEQNFEFNSRSIHPKESDLFEIIHIHYRKFLSTHYSM